MAGTPQVIIGGGHNAVSVGTVYLGMFGGVSTSTQGREAMAVCPHDTTLQNLKVNLTVAPGAGETYVFTVMKNNVAQSLAVTISNAETTGEDTSNTVDVTPGDYIEIRCVGSGGAAATYPSWSIEQDPDTEDDYWIGGCSQGSTGTAKVGSFYSHEGGGGSTVEERYLSPMPVAGTVKNLYVLMNADPGNFPDAYAYTVRRNFGSTSITCTIQADNVSGNDVVNTQAFSKGDLICMLVQPQNGPAVTPWYSFGVTVALDGADSGKSPMLGNTRGDPPSNAADEYSPAAGNKLGAWQAAESNLGQRVPDGTIKQLYVRAQTPPGVGTSHAFTVRIDGVDSNVVATLSDANQTANSAALNDSVSDGELLTIEADPTGAASTDDVGWGFAFEGSGGGGGAAEEGDIAAAHETLMAMVT